MNPSLDHYFQKLKNWQKEMLLLRTIINECKLVEEMKWGVPCYTYNGGNVVLIHGFKDYCAVLFMKGALLKDPKKILIQQTQNVQSGRQIRFTSASAISKLKPTIKAYVLEALEVEKAGLKVPLKKASDYPVPEEFQLQLNKNAALKKAFYALTPGRQRAYLLFFAGAKQSKTREARISKFLQHILQGKGMDDK